MKFIHAADIHLGNPFIGLDQTLPAHLKKVVQESTLTAFIALINAAISEKVDFLIIAGDLYNATKTSPKIQEVVHHEFFRLDEVDIPVYLSFGNHDFEADKQNHLPWTTNVHIFNQNVETQYLTLTSGEKIALTGFSYQTQRQTKKVIDEFPIKNQEVDYHIGVYHGAVGNNGDPYAPFNVTDMNMKNYDYWALGHIHNRQVLNTVPFIGYSGDLQGLNRKETGEKGYYLVNSVNHVLVPDFHDVSIIVWQNISLSDVNDERDLMAQIMRFETKKTTFLSVNLSSEINEALYQRIANGITLDKIREQLPPNLWIVRLTVSPDGATILAEDNIDQRYWQEALEQVFSDFNVSDYLSNQAPLFVREYFTSDEGKQLLRENMQRLIQDRKV